MGGKKKENITQAFSADWLQDFPDFEVSKDCKTAVLTMLQDRKENILQSISKRNQQRNQKCLKRNPDGNSRAGK